jgi:hypothetical protein
MSVFSISLSHYYPDRFLNGSTPLPASASGYALFEL